MVKGLRVIWLSLLFSICLSGIAFSAQVTTDTTDYFPGSTVTITGSGFAARESVTVQVTHADGTPTGGQGHDPWKVKANNAGGFTTYWVVSFDDNVGETLLVTATGKSSGLIATTTFVDAKVVDFRQVANEDTTDLVWINSILQQNNSKYFEHMSVPQRIIFVGTDSTVGNKHVLTLSHQATKGGDSTHAYDFITSWDQAIAAADFIALGQNLLSRLNSEACDPNIGPGTDSAMCDALRNGPNMCSGWVDDAMGSVLGDDVDTVVKYYEVQHGDRTFKIYGSQPVSLCSLVFLGYSPSGGDFYAEYRLVWTSASDSILIELAGRLALGPGGFGFSYGDGKGSSQISGGPYHFKLDQLDGDALGSQDNQIKGADINEPFVCPTCDVTGPADPVCPGDTNTHTVTDSGTCTNQSIIWSISGNGIIIGPDTGTSVTVVAGSTCNATYIVTATITCDNCTSGVSCSDTVLVNDNAPPVITCPTDKVFDCVLGATGTATATDNCDNNVAITSSDEIISTRCPRVIKRTWIATDDCGNADTCMQTITVQDTTKPVITFCPPNKVFDCVKGDTGVATATDNCGSVTISRIDSTVSARCPLVIKRTWTATDTCGYSSSCVQTITVQDTTKPVITCPTDKVFDCVLGNAGTATATDNCDPAPVITSKDSTVSARCPIIIKRTYTATDTCGNKNSCVQTITIQDTTKPVFTFCPPNKMFDCVKGDTGVATATDNCGSVTISRIDSTISARCPQIIKRTWTATDTCGNKSFCVQNITVQDTTKPTISGPADGNVFICKPGDLAKAPICASDNCSRVKLEKTSGGGSICNITGDSPVCCTLTFLADTTGKYVFIFKATDTCGNMAFDTVACNVKLNRPPVASCPPDREIVQTPPCRVCVGPFTCTDPDNNLASSIVTGGTLSGGQVCFDAEAGKKTYTITLICTDSCGLADTCSTSVTVDCKQVPTLSQWGLIIFSLLLLGFVTRFVYRRRKLSTPAG